MHPHYSSLFSRKSLEKDLPRRVSKLIGISMSKDDGLPERVCRGCMDKFYSLETSLNKFRERAMTSYMASLASHTPLVRLLQGIQQKVTN